MPKKKAKIMKERGRVIERTKSVKKSGKANKNQLKLLQDVAVTIAGFNASEVVNLMHGKENVNEFNIARKLNITINQARNILYKLGDEGIVSFTGKKDKKSGGWYTYFWTLDINKSLYSLKNKLTDEILRLEYQIASKKVKRFYFCKTCDIEMSEENALQYDFTCPECGEVFELKDNVSVVSQLENEIKNLNEKLKLVNEELDEIFRKEEIVKKRKLTLEDKKKKIERKARRELREKEKGKIGKQKVAKKKVKKKIKRVEDGKVRKKKTLRKR